MQVNDIYVSRMTLNDRHNCNPFPNEISRDLTLQLFFIFYCILYKYTVAAAQTSLSSLQKQSDK